MFADHTARHLRFAVFGLCAVALVACAASPPPAPPGPLIVVPPVSGLESARAVALAEAMAEALVTTENLNARAGRLNEGLPAEAFIMGRVERAEDRETLMWLSTRWAVMTPDGSTLGTVEREIVVDKVRWMNADPLIMGFAVSETGPDISSALIEGAVVLPPPAPEPEPEMVEPEPLTVADVPVEDGDPDVSKLMVDPATLPKPGEPTSAESVLETVVPAGAEPADAMMAEEPAMAEGAGTAEEVLGQMGGPAIEGVDPARPQPATQQAAAPAVEAPRDTILPGPPTPDPNAWARAPIFLVRPVYGAPGTGNRELTQSVRSELQARGAQITDNPALASHVMQGSVRVSPAFGGKQKTRIVWLVTTVSGEELGTATQENAVAAGSLDGGWGVIAGHIAEAAVDGVQELFGIEIGRAGQ